MNSYHDLAQQMLQRGLNRPTQPAQDPMMPLTQMRQFMQTAAGRQAARAAIDRVIVDNRLMGQKPAVPHQQIFQTIQGLMQHAQNLSLGTGGFSPVIDAQAQPPDISGQPVPMLPSAPPPMAPPQANPMQPPPEMQQPGAPPA